MILLRLAINVFQISSSQIVLGIFVNLFSKKKNKYIYEKIKIITL